MKQLLALTLAVFVLSGCTYSYKPKAEDEVPAYVALRGKLLGEPAKDPKNYTVDITGVNGATFSMVPPSLNSDRPAEMPISPGPNKLKLYVTFPKTSMGEHMDMPFIAKAGEHYHVTYDINKDGKHAITLLDSHGKIAQGVTFSVITVTQMRMVPIKIGH